MVNNNKEYSPLSKKVPWLTHIVVSVVIFVIAIFIVVAMFSNKPEAKRWGGQQEAPSVAVDVMDLQVDNYQVWIDSYGTAQPLTQTELVADVSARVVSVSPNIRAGSTFNKGDVLVQLDPRDFEINVEIAKSDVAQAELVYLQELAEADFSAQQWNKQPKGEAAKLLALRKPQVAAAQAALNAAKARLRGAQLNLERTTIRAPFDGMVLSQSVDIGQVVSPNQTIASIYSTDVIEVRLPVKTSELQYLNLLNDNAQEARSTVYLTGDLGATSYTWEGEIVRSEGAFDPTTRTLFLVAQVTEPFKTSAQRPALRVGQFLNAKIQGQLLSDVFIVPRQAVSQNNKVSVVDNGVLRKRAITPLWTDTKSVVVSAAQSSDDRALGYGINQGDKVILTPTANIPDGTKVKTLADSLGGASVASDTVKSRDKANAVNTEATK